LVCLWQLYKTIRTHCEAFMPGMADDALDAIAELHRVSVYRWCYTSSDLVLYTKCQEHRMSDTD
jgi:hypothetical protein